MKKLLLSLGLIAVCGIGYLLADNKADIDTMNGGKTNTAYGTYTSTDGWTATNSALAKVGDDLTVVLNGKTSAVGTLTSPTLTGGIGILTFNYTNTYSESNGVSVRIDIKQNGAVVSSQTLTTGKNEVTQNTVYTYTSNAFNVEGDFTIEITNLSPSNSTSNKDRVSIWNISWTSYGEGGGNTGGTTDPDPDPDPVDPDPSGDVTTVAFYASPAYSGSASITTQIGTGSGTLSIAGTEETASHFTAGDITIWIEKVNSSVSQANSGLVRWYQNDKLHIVPSNGAIITNVNFTATQGAFTASTGTVSGYEWTGSTNQELILTTTAQVRFSVMDVTYEGGELPAVATPKISCTDNTVTISCETDGAEIYYTLDNTEPTQSSTKYANPFAITENLTVKAIAYKDGVASAVGTYNAVYVGNYNGFEAFVNAGVNAEGTVDGPITVVYQNGQYLYVVDNLNYPMLVYGTVNQSLTNGQTISEISGKYSPYSGLPELTNPTLGTIGTGTPVSPQNVTDVVNNDMINRYVKFENVTIDASKNMTYGNNTIVLYSRFNNVTFPTDYTKNYNVTGFVSIFNGTLQIYPTEFEEVTDVNQVSAPVFSPDGGAVNSGDEVEITCDTPGASIYYTLDGSDPTQESNLYNAPIAITEAVTIKAIAVKEGMTDSYVTSADFTVINPSAKEVTFNFAEPSTLDSSYTDDTEVTGEASAVILTGKTFTNGVISISFAAPESATNTNSPRLYCGSSAGVYSWTLRFYKDNTITITAANDYQITSIDFVATNLGNSSITWSAGSYSNNTWTPSTNSAIQLMSDDDDVKELVIGKTATGNNPTITSMTVHYDFKTGVESIEDVDNGEAVYYNLQGVKVANPDRGLYIKVQNGKATKIMK